MRKNDKNTTPAYIVARIMRGIRGTGVLKEKCKSVLGSSKQHRRNILKETHRPPVAFLVALLPVNSPASSTSLNSGVLPLPPLLLLLLLAFLLTRLSIPAALSPAAILRSTVPCMTRRYSYNTPSATIMRKERTNWEVVVMCHWGNTMHVFSIWVFLSHAISKNEKLGSLWDAPEHIH